MGAGGGTGSAVVLGLLPRESLPPPPCLPCPASPAVAVLGIIFFGAVSETFEGVAGEVSRTLGRLHLGSRGSLFYFSLGRLRLGGGRLSGAVGAGLEGAPGGSRNVKRDCQALSPVSH